MCLFISTVNSFVQSDVLPLLFLEIDDVWSACMCPVVKYVLDDFTVFLCASVCSAGICTAESQGRDDQVSGS